MESLWCTLEQLRLRHRELCSEWKPGLQVSSSSQFDQCFAAGLRMQGIMSFFYHWVKMVVILLQ